MVSSRILLSALVGMSVMACAPTFTSTTELPQSLGGDIYSVDCRGGVAKCLKQIAKVCDDKEPKVINQYTKSGGAIAHMIPGPFVWHIVEYQCGKPKVSKARDQGL